MVAQETVANPLEDDELANQAALVRFDVDFEAASRLDRRLAVK